MPKPEVVKQNPDEADNNLSYKLLEKRINNEYPRKITVVEGKINFFIKKIRYSHHDLTPSL